MKISRHGSFASGRGIIAALASTQVMGLRGPGLPGHLNSIERQLGRCSRSVIDDSPHRLTNEIEVILIHRELGLRDDWLILEQARNDALSGRKTARHRR